MKRKRPLCYSLIDLEVGMKAYDPAPAVMNFSCAMHPKSSVKAFATKTVPAGNSTDPAWNGKNKKQRVALPGTLQLERI